MGNTHSANGSGQDPPFVAVGAELGPREDESKWVLDGIGGGGRWRRGRWRNPGWWWWDCSSVGIVVGGRIVGGDCRDNRPGRIGRRIGFLRDRMIAASGVVDGLLGGSVCKSNPW